MKLFDKVEIINDKYEKMGIPKGTRGAIVLPEIRDCGFEIEVFDLPKSVFALQHIKIEDMKVTKSSDIGDEIILEELPKKNPKWWCKVENGYIMNLLGEKKNKIPYDYNS